MSARDVVARLDAAGVEAVPAGYFIRYAHQIGEIARAAQSLVDQGRSRRRR